MSQTVNLVTNPSAETNLTGYTSIPGTTGVAPLTRPTTGGAAGAGFVRATWSTASTAAGGGIQYGDIPVTAGQVYCFGVAVRSSIINRLQLNVEWRTASATISTASGAQTVVAAAAWTRLSTAALTAPATATIARIKAVSVAGTSYANWGIGSTLDVDAVLAVRAATLPVYGDPSTSGMWAWSGVAHASTSTLFAPTITANPHTDMAPVPRVEVVILDLPPGTISLQRQADGRTRDVRGALDVSTAGSGVAPVDHEPEFKTPIVYKAEIFSPAGVSIGFTPAVTTSVEFEGTVIHQPLDPSLAIKATVKLATAETINRPTPSETVWADGATEGRIFSGRRRGLVGLPLVVKTSSLADATMFQAMLGTYSTEQMPVLCIRTSLPIRIPRTLFISVPDATERGITVHANGEIVNFGWVGDEVQPPTPGLVVPLITWDDVAAAYPGGWSEVAAAYAGWLELSRDYTIAGAAG